LSLIIIDEFIFDDSILDSIVSNLVFKESYWDDKVVYVVECSLTLLVAVNLSERKFNYITILFFEALNSITDLIKISS